MVDESPPLGKQPCIARLGDVISLLVPNQANFLLHGVFWLFASLGLVLVCSLSLLRLYAHRRLIFQVK
jgi:hypothetical protein